MPLYKGVEPFKRAPSIRHRKSSKVYFCEETGEAFESYEKLFDRMLTLNTSLWTCAVTLKSGLTFEEAMKSEKSAHQGFPIYGQKPLYFFVKKYFREDSIENVVSELTDWMRNRFFKGEWVRTYNGDKFTMAKVVDVEYCRNSKDLKSIENYTYSVETFDEVDGENVIYECGHENLERLESYSTEEFLLTEFNSNLIKEGNHYIVSESKDMELSLAGYSFADFFVGPEPNSKEEESSKAGHSSDTKPSLSAYAIKERNAKIMRRKMLMERANKGTDAVEDTSLDLSEKLPDFTSLSLPNFVPTSDFGHMLSIYAFLRAFGKELDINGAFSFRTLIKSIYSDDSYEFERFVFIFLQARNACVATEDFDEADVDDPSDIPDEYRNELAGKNGAEIKKRCKLLESIRLRYGSSLQSIPLNQQSLSEVLNLTLRTAGYCPRSVAMGVRKEKRGVISCASDELFLYSLENPQVLEKLSESHIAALSATERIYLLRAFVQTLLSYGKFRTVHENSYAQLENILEQMRKLSIIELQYKGEYEDTEKLLSMFEGFKFKRNGHSKKIEGYLQEFREKPSVYKCLKIAQMKFRFDYFVQEDRELLYDIHKKAIVIKTKELIQNAQRLFKEMGGVLLGNDRHQRNYFYVFDLSVVFIETSEDWKILSSQNDIYKLMTTLQPYGRREGRLLSALKLCIERVGRTTEAFGFTESSLFQFPTPGIKEYKMDLFASDNAIRTSLLQLGEKLYEKAFINQPLLSKFPEWKGCLSSTQDTTNVFGESDVVIEYNDEVVLPIDQMSGLTRIQKLAIGLFQLVNNIQLECLKVPFIDNSDGEVKPTITLVEFMRSLLTITSDSQFFVHLSVFESMIRWAHRSPHQAKCTVCNVRGPLFIMVKCVYCNDKAHKDCLDETEREEWTCYSCVKRAASLSNRVRKTQEKIPKTDESINDKENGFLDSPQSTSSRPASTRKRVAPRSDDYVYNQVNGSIKKEDSESQESGRSKRSRRNITTTPKLEDSGLTFRNTKNVREMFEKMVKVISTARNQEFGFAFADPVGKQLPGYSDVISHPMDMHTMLNKINWHEYDHPSEIWQDFHVMFSNCEQYHEDGSYSEEAKELEAFVRPQFEQILDEKLEPYPFRS
ncbi:unnamed protein product [Bursaphelenchus xylophilus]|uniref:(pine wood nematode) hypothetical protein n=1 Tax=Bursaphelenchus xylophilus TaxID=6326 RepID=A0A1I7SWP6_BURXY|nr:unnamed protein product [Bursaphelenchus xylophilus]CAG9099769.1 unnamed protein product [Bursaphelenchus xylophilus]